MVLAIWSDDNHFYDATIEAVVKKNRKFQYRVRFVEDGIIDVVWEHNLATESDYQSDDDLPNNVAEPKKVEPSKKRKKKKQGGRKNKKRS
jgi:hypothetical protein